MTVDSLDALTGLEPAPDAVVVDLEVPDAMQAVAVVRRHWPDALVAAFVSVPERARWEAAADAFDLVATRGAIAGQVAARLETWTGPKRSERERLFDERDAAGRLGLVHRGETAAGPVAVYHIGRRLFAVGDTCPHAGARLSDGMLDGPILTCPLHGSQFDVRDGSRVRGPSDEPLRAYDLVVEDGVVYLDLTD